MKESRSGKYSPNKEWGEKRHWTPTDWGKQPGFNVGEEGQRLGFRGSGIRSFRYYDEVNHVYKVIRAHNAVEAAQIAWSFGGPTWKKDRKNAKFKR